MFFERRTLTASQQKKYVDDPNLGWADRILLKRGTLITGPSEFVQRFRNSLIIAGTSTVLSVVFGLLAAYAFSRWDISGKPDLLFFILSTRMLPPVVVTIPLFLMYRQVGIYDSHIGMILLYTVFNLSFSVWLLKGFIDEIPREYEEAALVDGYSRLQAFTKVVLPQAMTGIAATTVFCLIFAWNEYAFSLMLTSDIARTAPPSIATTQGAGGHRVRDHRHGLDALPDSGGCRDLCAAPASVARCDVRRDPSVVDVRTWQPSNCDKLKRNSARCTPSNRMDLTINSGEFVVLLGPSGCGKTTTLRMISGLEAVSGGHIYLDGRDVTWLHPSERDIAFVFQFFALYPHMSVHDNIRFPAAGTRCAGSRSARRDWPRWSRCCRSSTCSSCDRDR